MMQPTREVYNAKGHFMRINASDYDPKVHFDEKPEPKPKPKPKPKAKQG